jgi:hypothetical protein
MATVENFRESLGGYRLDLELKNVPIGFVNGLRRVALSEIPVVVLTNVQILDNNTQLTHEMIRHRVEMLPINVLPEETAVLRDTRVELRYLPPSPEAAHEERVITTDQFQIAGPRKDIILKDRDLEEPLYFMTLAPNESLHIRASLGIDPRGSHVSVSTFSNHVDPDLAKVDKLFGLFARLEKPVRARRTLANYMPFWDDGFWLAKDRSRQTEDAEYSI